MILDFKLSDEYIMIWYNDYVIYWKQSLRVVSVGKLIVVDNAIVINYKNLWNCIIFKSYSPISLIKKIQNFYIKTEFYNKIVKGTLYS